MGEVLREDNIELSTIIVRYRDTFYEKSIIVVDLVHTNSTELRVEVVILNE